MQRPDRGRLGADRPPGSAAAADLEPEEKTREEHVPRVQAERWIVKWRMTAAVVVVAIAVVIGSAIFLLSLEGASSIGEPSAPTTSCAHGPLWSEAGAGCCSSQRAFVVKREEKEGCI